MANQRMLNGLDTKKLSSTINAVKQDPSLAGFRFHAKSEWESGYQNHTEVRDFKGPSGEKLSHKVTFKFDSDEPEELLGQDKGANATEVVLHALASCLAVTLITHATLKNIKIDQMFFELEGNLDLNGFLGVSDKERNGFQKIKVNCKIKSDASSETLQQLCDLAQEHSPVFDIITNPVPVSVSMTKME